MKLYFIDLFCGAGGVTTGLHNATIDGKNIAEVIACVNHDKNAIKSHYLNHPNTVHFTEDIRTLDIYGIIEMVKAIRLKDPKAKICIWASLECTNFSRAKGGLPRNADSRTLAEHLYRYIEQINPDYIYIENVEEFMSWGPLDKNGKPINKKSGRDYLRWIQHIKSYGYAYDYRILNSADYGAYTSRKRYFGMFAKGNLPIKFPEATHSKKGAMDQFGSLKKWKPVKEVLDFSDEGKSIFERNKPLSDKTLERIYAGLIKYVAGGKEAFMSKYYSGDPKSKNSGIDNPAGTITTIDHHSLIRVKFLMQSNGGNPNSKVFGTDRPARTITTKDKIAIVKPKYWLDKQYSGSENHQSIDQPAGTVLLNDKHCLMKAQHFIDKQYSQGGRNQSVDSPSGSLTTVPKMSLVTAKWIMNTNFNNVGSSIDSPAPVITANRKHHYLVNPSWSGNTGCIDEPCCTVVARQDKSPLYLVSMDKGPVAIAVYDNDSEIMIKIKEFMVLYEIIDIKMRMLKIVELLKIQGFPDNYILIGTQAEQKKFIGNAVVKVIPESWAIVIYKALNELNLAA